METAPGQKGTLAVQQLRNVTYELLDQSYLLTLTETDFNLFDSIFHRPPRTAFQRWNPFIRETLEK